MADLSMLKRSDVMPDGSSEAVSAKLLERVLPEGMIPAVFKMAAPGQSVYNVAPGIIGKIAKRIRIILIGSTSHHDNIASTPDIIIAAVVSRCVIKYFFGPFYGLPRFAVGLL
jgi:hypothetical protein